MKSERLAAIHAHEIAFGWAVPEDKIAIWQAQGGLFLRT